MRPILKSVIDNTLQARAKRFCGGSLPTYYFDLVANRALIAGRDIGPVSNTPSLTGTLDLIGRGHLCDAADNGLVIPLAGVTYPLMFVLETIRLTDTGGNEVMAVLDDGTIANTAFYRVDTGDQIRLRVDTLTVNQCNVAGSGVAWDGITRRVAGRIASGSAQAARGNSGILGTEDTSVTLPANPSRLILGVDSLGAHTFTGLFTKAAIVSGLTPANGQLVASALAA